MAFRAATLAAMLGGGACGSRRDTEIRRLPDYIIRWNLSKTEAKRGANRGCELCLENSVLPDVA